MASDSFTETNDTLLATHDAKWTSVGGSYVVTTMTVIGASDVVQCNTEWNYYGAYYNNSQSADPQMSQAVLKAQAAGYEENKFVAVRMASVSENPGYGVCLATISGANYTRLMVHKNAVWLANASVTGTYAIASDHTLKIEVSGTSTTTIKIYEGGSQVGNDITDSSSPITTGYPGIYGFDGGALGNTAYDDWTDAGATSPTLIQEGFRFRNDDGSETTATWKADQDTNIYWSE